MSELALVAIGDPPPAVLEHLADFLPRLTGRACSIAGVRLDPAVGWVASRRQVDARRLLPLLERCAAETAATVLGVADLDLFSPIFTHVFGEARLAGSAGLFSLHRLRPAFYGLPADPELLLARARREALHELGHLMGLHHCRSLECVMRFSTVVEEVDLKPDAFCDSCRQSVAPRDAHKS